MCRVFVLAACLLAGASANSSMLSNSAHMVLTELPQEVLAMADAPMPENLAFEPEEMQTMEDDWANEKEGPQSDRKLFFKMEPGSKALKFSLSHRKLQSGPQSDRKLFFKMEPGSKALKFSLSHRNLQDDGEGEEERKLGVSWGCALSLTLIGC